MTSNASMHSPLILVNVFKVEPAKQQQLVDLLVEASQTMKHIKGYISANIHKSLDGQRVVNYAQWESKADFDAMLKNPQATPHRHEAASLAISNEPILCESTGEIGAGLQE